MDLPRRGADADEPITEPGLRAGPVQGKVQRVNKARLVLVLVGLAIGGALGAWHGFAAGGPSGLVSGAFVPAVAAGVMLLGLAFVTLVLRLRASTRSAARATLTVMAVAVIGWPIGNLLGPRWQPPRTYAGTAHVAFTTPEGQGVSGPARCTTLDNDSTVARVEASTLGTIGADAVGIDLSIYAGEGSFELLVGETSAYHADFTIEELGDENRTGRADFRGTRELGHPGLGTPGAPVIEGSLEWECAGVVSD